MCLGEEARGRGILTGSAVGLVCHVEGQVERLDSRLEGFTGGEANRTEGEGVDMPQALLLSSISTVNSI